MNSRALASLIITLVLVIGGVGALFGMYEHLDNSQIMVVQSPFSGKLTWYTDVGGIKWQGFGTCTKYQKRSQFWFSSKMDQGKPQDDAITTRFNDGAHADLSGSFSWDMPMDNKMLTDLHTKFGSQKSVEQELIRTTTEKSIYLTGPLMSSAESYATRRNDLLNFVSDQMAKGVYKTEANEVKTKDTMTGQEKTVKLVSLVKTSNGEYAREDQSPLELFGIKIFGLSFNKVKYNADVERQIQAQQQAVMEVQTSIVNARKAEQAAITAEKNGEAEAATAKWKQEVIKATEVTKAEQEKLVAETAAKREKVVAETFAEQRKNVAEFDLASAKLKKETEIALGEGESQRKKLVMQADGALEKKLEAYVKINELYASAIGQYKGNWVPTIQQGASSGSQNGAVDLMNLLSIKAAKDLALDLSLPAAPAQK